MGVHWGFDAFKRYLSQLMRLWYLSHMRPAKARASLRIRAVTPEPSLFAHMKYESRRKIRQNIRHLAPLDVLMFSLVLWTKSVTSVKHHTNKKL